VCGGTYVLSLVYRDPAELAREFGVSVAPSTILRWVVRYVPEFEKCWQAYERPVGDSWRVDETYPKVGGQWMYLYRAVDKQGKTVESYLSRTLDVTAAKAFFRKAPRRAESNYPGWLLSRPMPLCAAWVFITNSITVGTIGPDSKLSLLEQRRRTRSPEGKKPREPDALIQALLQRTVLVQTVERLGILR
jgi:hypothetical protein